MIAFFLTNWTLILEYWSIGFVITVALTVLTAGIQNNEYKLNTFLGCLVWPFAIFYDIGAAIGSFLAVIAQRKHNKNASSDKP